MDRIPSILIGNRSFIGQAASTDSSAVIAIPGDEERHGSLTFAMVAEGLFGYPSRLADRIMAELIVSAFLETLVFRLMIGFCSARVDSMVVCEAWP